MGSQARVAANRRNAAKSTGPRTTEGKAVVAQNAVKHGLWARQAVLRNEDSQEFELHRSRMLRKLDPDGPEQEAMAERIVGLWWRLKRAERMQDEALDYLIEADRGSDWVKCCREDGDPSARAAMSFGRAVARDFAETRTLDRLTMHERRIESSLYRTMKELRLVRREQEGQDGHGASSSHNVRNHDGWQRQAQPAELADGVGLHPDAIGKPALAAATRQGTSDSAKQSQFEAPQEDHRQASLDAATREGTSDCVKQSQFEEPQEDHRQAALDAATQQGTSDSVKQSQFEAPQEDHRQASLDAATREGTSDCVKQSQFEAPQEDHRQASLDAATQQGTSDSVKQSQFGAAEGGHCPPCRTANGDGNAKQSQCRKPAAGAGAMLRPRPRVAYHCHDIARSY